MKRLPATLLTLALSAGAAVLLSACGGGSDAKLLPGRTADEITANLESVQQLVDEGECVGAQDAAQQVSSQVDAVGGIDRRLKAALEDGALKLNEVVGECDEEVEATDEETTTSPAESADREAEEKEAEKEEKEAEKEAEREEKEAEKEAELEEKAAEQEQQQEEQEEVEEVETPPSLPPQANGEAKGHEAPDGGPSGGIGPGGEAEGHD